MLGRWIDEVRLKSPIYERLSDEELRKTAEDWIDGIYHAVADGDYSHLVEISNRIAPSRSEGGFRFSEVMKAIALAGDIATDAIIAANEERISEGVAKDIRRLNEVMNWMIMSFGDAFEETARKQFSAATLIGLVTAQEAVDEKELMSKLLGICHDLLKCTHGAVMMIDHRGFIAELQGGDESSRMILEKIGTEVIRGRNIVMKKEGFDEMLGEWRIIRTESAMKCALGLPIMARGKILGALILGSYTERMITNHEVRLLQALAAQIGLAYENNRMIRQLSKKADYLKNEHDEVLTILNELGAIVYVADMETYEVLAANRPMRETYGNDLVGSTCYKSIQVGMDGPCPFCTNKYLVKNGHPTGPYLWDFQNTTTGRKYRLSDRAIEWPDGRLVRLEIGLDITDFEEAKEKLDDIRTMLQLYNDLLVHDIRNHTSIAKGFLELMSDEKMSRDQRIEMAQTAFKQMNKIDVLVDRIATLEKAKATGHEEMIDIDLREVLDSSIADAEAMVEAKDIEIKREYGQGQFMVKAGEFVHEIFINLLSNAVKYGNGKPVIVKIESSSMDEMPSWKVSVVDEGKGVHPEKKALLFRRYERLTTISQLKGLGLGLTIVRTLTETYGGRVTVEDRVPGEFTKGTVFSIEFPKSNNDPSKKDG